MYPQSVVVFRARETNFGTSIEEREILTLFEFLGTTFLLEYHTLGSPGLPIGY